MPFWPIHVGSRWKMQERRPINNTEIKHNPEKANNAKNSKKLPWFIRHFTTLGQETSCAYSTVFASPQRAGL